jgi:group I intron endonuclease
MVLHGWIILLTFALSNRSYMEDRYIIYLHVNKINNKVYVGITKHSNPELRWRCGYKNNPYFNYSIKKYGWDGFDHIVLFRNLPKEIACKLEIKLIARYRKKGICYNIANGGEGSIAMSESTRNKLRKYKGIRSSQYGKKRTKDRIEKQRVIALHMWETRSKEEVNASLKPYQYKAGSLHPNYGKPISNIHKDRIKVALSKAVLMIDKSTNEILREFESATDAETFLSKRSHHISSCCNNKRKSAYGYIWRYKNKENCI